MSLTDKSINKTQILDWYTQDVLEGNAPTNVYMFTKKHKIEETVFYSHFNDLSALDSYFFVALFDATIDTLNSSVEFITYTPKEKFLSFYYTFFENLRMNRSFVKYALQNQSLKDLKKLRALRSSFLEFVNQIDLHKIDFKQKDVNKAQDKVVAESAWLHLLGTLKYWLNDTSPDFEKTDVFIEKSLNAGFEITNLSAIRSVADFGKFLFKELKPSK